MKYFIKHLWSFSFLVLLPIMSLWANHPTPGQMTQVKKLAHELEEKTLDTYNIAKDLAHHDSSQEEQALRDLYKFYELAQHFHHAVEDNSNTPEHTEKDFRNLHYAWVRVENTFWELHAFESVKERFSEMEKTFLSLQSLYRGGWDQDNIATLATQVTTSARHLYQMARKLVHTYSQKQALAQIRILVSRAEYFKTMFNEYYTDAHHTEKDFYELRRSFNQAEGAIRIAYFENHHFQEDFSRMKRHMRQLELTYHEENSSVWSTQDVKNLVHQIDEQTRHMQKKAEQEREPGSNWFNLIWKNRAIRSLQALASRAHHLHEQIHENHLESAHTYSDYKKMIDTYKTAKQNIDWAYFSHYFTNDWEKMKKLIRRLRSYYEDDLMDDHNDPHHDDH